MISRLAGAGRLVLWAARFDLRRLGITLLLGCLSGAAVPVAAIMSRGLIEDVIAGDGALVMALSLALVALVLVALLFEHFAYVPVAELSEQAVVESVSELSGVLTTTESVHRLSRPAIADKVRAVYREISTVPNALLAVLALTSLIVSMPLTIVLLVQQSPWLLLAIGTVLPSVWVVLWSQRVRFEAQARSAGARRRLSHVISLVRNAESAGEIRVHRAAPLLASEIDGQWREITDNVITAEKRVARVQVVSALARCGVVALLVCTLMIGLRNGVLSPADGAMALILVYQLGLQISRLAGLLEHLVRAGEGTSARTELRALLGSTRPERRGRGVGEITRGVVLRDVSVRYEGRDNAALDRVELELAAGSVYAVLGGNGAGKSTLIRLLAKLEAPSAGAVLVDGLSLEDIPYRVWAARVGVVPQHTPRFEFLVRENVGMGGSGDWGDDTVLWRALRKGSAKSIVEKLPRGLDTQLGRSWTAGEELSGGEWQRVALSRGLMRSAPVLMLLDEPAANVDAHNEKSYLNDVLRVARDAAAHNGCITLIVTHDSSVCPRVDEVILLDDGKVAEQGNHDALLAAGGQYAALYQRQNGVFA
jgi:ATP-binding cassette, subfamily B, bacterial